MRKDECYRVQEEIKSGRGGRQVQISFPDDVLHSGRLQNMLESKVMILKTKWTFTYMIGYQLKYFQAVTMEELLTQPSFPEFVDWLVRNRAGKEDKPAAWAEENAWLPFYAVCPICQLPYTVLKLEDPEEMEELLKHMKLKLPHWATPVHTIGGRSSSASKATRCFKSGERELI